MAEDNTIYVGSKGVMSYVLAVVTQFNQGADEVEVKARGKSISRAVDVAEIVKNKFLDEINIEDISTKTEKLENDDGSESKVSAITIRMTAPQ